MGLLRPPHRRHRRLRLATRGSPLALWQTRHVAALLRRMWPGLGVDIVIVAASGDADVKTPLYALGAVGVFVKEIQHAVLAGEADAGVHSAKDLPTTVPDGLCLAAVLTRADPRDGLIGAPSIAALPQGALIGTSSLRRQTQLAALRPDLRFTSLRGNVGTRLAKLAAGDATATVMAMAGLNRLGLARAVGMVPLDPRTECTPAPAQGAIGIDCRADDGLARTLIGALTDAATATAIGIERTVLAGLAGGCSLPLGCHAWRDTRGAWQVLARLGVDGGLRTGSAAGSVPADVAARVLDQVR